MKVLHITPSTDGYEEVTLLANNVSKNNSLQVIDRNGEIFMTGGIILGDSVEIRSILDSFPKNKHYDIAYSFRQTPYVKEMYYEQ